MRSQQDDERFGADYPPLRFVFLIVLSPPLALAAATVLPPLAAATWWYRRRSGVAYGQAREAIANVNANLQENLSGVRVAQAYVREDRNVTGFRSVNEHYLRHRLRAQRLIALYFPFVLFLADLGAVAVLGARAIGLHVPVLFDAGLAIVADDHPGARVSDRQTRSFTGAQPPR